MTKIVKDFFRFCKYSKLIKWLIYKSDLYFTIYDKLSEIKLFLASKITLFKKTSKIFIPVEEFTGEKESGKSSLQFHSQVEMKASPSQCNPATKASRKTAVCKKTMQHIAEPEQAKESLE